MDSLSRDRYVKPLEKHRNHIAKNIYGDIEPIRMVANIPKGDIIIKSYGIYKGKTVPMQNEYRYGGNIGFWYACGQWDRFNIKITYDYNYMIDCNISKHKKGDMIAIRPTAITPYMSHILTFMGDVARVIDPKVMLYITRAMSICKIDPESDTFSDILVDILKNSDACDIIKQSGNIQTCMYGLDNEKVHTNGFGGYDKIFPTVETSIVGVAVLVRMHCHADKHSLCPRRTVYDYGDRLIIDDIEHEIDFAGYCKYGDSKWKSIKNDIKEKVKKYERGCTCMICIYGKKGMMINDMTNNINKLRNTIKIWEMKHQVLKEDGSLDIWKLSELGDYLCEEHHKLSDIYKKRFNILLDLFGEDPESDPEDELEMLINDEAWAGECDNSDPGDELEMLINNETWTRECDKKGEGI